MKRKNKVKVLILSCFLLLLIQGCWGARETDELGYILAVGIDKGKNNLFNVTFQIAVPQPLGEGGEKATEIISLEAASLFGAVQLADAFINKDVTFIHNVMVIVSEEIAKEGINELINTMVRDRDIRRTTFFLVAKGETGEIIKNNKPLFEKYTSRQMSLFMESERYTGFIVKTNVHEVYQNLKVPGRGVVASLVGLNENNGEGKRLESLSEKVLQDTGYLPGEIPRQGGNALDFIGLAAFRGPRLIGFLNGAETLYYNMITGRLGYTFMSFSDPREPEKSKVSVKVFEGRNPEIRVAYNDGMPVLKIKLVLEGELLSIESGINYEKDVLQKELEQHIEDIISAGAKEVIARTQTEFQSDIFGFGDYTRGYYLTWEDWKNSDWSKKYPFAEVEVETIFKVRRPGLMIETSPDSSSEGGG